MTPRRPFPLQWRFLTRLFAAGCLVGGAAIGFPTPGVAQPDLGETSTPDTSYLAGDAEVQGLGITLDQSRRLAAENAPAARIALAAVRSARGSWMQEAGAFDPVLIGAGERLSTDSPVTSPFASSELRQRSLSTGASWLSPIGTTLNVTLSQVTTESNAPFSTLPRERRARARFDFTQPLLRGFGPTASRGELRAARRELDAARFSLQMATLDLDAEVESAYWELYAAERNLTLQRVQRQRAATFLREQMLRARAGVVGPGVVAIARTFLAQQEAVLLRTRVQLGAAADRLAQTIGISPGSQARYHCLDEPPPPPSPEPLEGLVQRALEGSPSIRGATAGVEAARARARRAAWNAWPSLEAFGGYGGSGLAGTGRTVVFGSDTVGANFDTDFGEAWDQVRGDDFPDWNFGLRVTMPLGWRADRGEHQRQLGQYERAREDLRARRLALESAVRNAHREVELSSRALAAMRELVNAAQEQARIARLEYQAGRSTTYEVVNLEADLVSAEFQLSEVLVRVARADADLRRLTTAVPKETKP